MLKYVSSFRTFPTTDRSVQRRERRATAAFCAGVHHKRNVCHQLPENSRQPRKRNKRLELWSDVWKPHVWGKLLPPANGVERRQCLCVFTPVYHSVQGERGAIISSGVQSLAGGAVKWGAMKGVPWRTPPYVDKRAVRILLECILVCYISAFQWDWNVY